MVTSLASNTMGQKGPQMTHSSLCISTQVCLHWGSIYVGEDDRGLSLSPCP
jgi:hypothetical protein